MAHEGGKSVMEPGDRGRLVHGLHPSGSELGAQARRRMTARPRRLTASVSWASTKRAPGEVRAKRAVLFFVLGAR